MTRTRLAAGVLVVWLATVARADASPGDLDPSFGGTGTVTTPSGRIGALVLQHDGKLVAAGACTLVRYEPDGALDATFGRGTGISMTAPGCLAILKIAESASDKAASVNFAPL